jgi:hypothetical protein
MQSEKNLESNKSARQPTLPKQNDSKTADDRSGDFRESNQYVRQRHSGQSNLNQFEWRNLDDDILPPGRH